MRSLRLVSGISLVMAACIGGQEEALTDAEHRVKAADLSEEDARSVNFVKRVVEGYRDFKAARIAGYSVQYPQGCVQTSAGSQGLHFSNPALLDGKAEMNRPELLMFEPQPDGSMALVGVDYVIPFEHWKLKDPPQLIGRRFMRNEDLQAWTLHIWTHRENPEGVFALYNPHVSCRSAANVPEAAAQ